MEAQQYSNIIMDNLSNIPTRSDVLIFTILLKHVDKRAIQGTIYVLKGVLIALMKSIFSERFFKHLSGFLVLICAAIIVYIIIAEYHKGELSRNSGQC